MHKSKILGIIGICIIIINLIVPVYADDKIEDIGITIEELEKIIETSTDITKEPSINSRNAVIFDRTSGSILYGKNENKRCKMASTTKIMTAIIVVENTDNLNEKVTISKKSAGTGGSSLGLHVNDEITVNNLLYGLLLCSRK